MEDSCNFKLKSSHILGKSFKSASVGLHIFWLAIVLASSICVAVAQTNSVSLNLKSVTVKEALEKLKNQTGYSVWFNAQDVALNKKISVNIQKQSIQKALDEILQGQDLSYELKGKSIQIRKNQVQEKKGTTHQITGKVFDQNDKSPLIGCNVRVKGKTTGTITDLNGSYTLEVSPKDVLVFTFIGYDPWEEAVGNKTVFNLYLEDQSISLGDVVVTGYQVLKKFNTTGAVSTLNQKSIELRSSVGLQGLLEGTVPGLTVYNGKYRIRGGASLDSGNTPLFIVDDFEVDEEDIPQNMDVVENITVLKDAAATAIWGSRAANGVVVISTKKGKDKDFKISYSNSFKVSSKPDFNDLNRVNSEQLISYQTEAYDKAWIGSYMFDGSASGYSPSYEAFIDFDHGDITREEMESRLASLAAMSNEKQIKDKLLRNAFSQQHFLSISGASDKVNYFLSGSFNGGNSTYIGDKNQSANINSRTSYKLTSFITLRSDINASFANKDDGYGGIIGDIYNLDPYQMLQDENGYVYDYSLLNKIEAERLQGLGFYSWQKNILEEVDLSNNKSSRTAYKVRVGSDFTIMKGLNLSVDYQYNKSTETKKEIISKDSYVGREAINYMTEITDNNKLMRHLPAGNIIDKDIADVNSWIFRAVVTLNRTFGEDDKHYVNAVAGFEGRKRVLTSESYRKFGYDDDLLIWQPIDQAALSKDGITWWDNNKHTYDATRNDYFRETDTRERSYFGSAVYTYDSRYTLSGSVRIDESNLFGVSDKYRRNPIWSVGANWNIANESFFSSNMINNLILRGSVGLTGNFDRTGATTPVMVAKRMYLASVNDFVTRISTPPNPYLRWERNRSINVSADISLWNRLNASLSYYNNYCYDLLGETNLDPTTGYNNARINAADMENSGIELTVNGDIIRTRNFSWNAGFVFAYNKNKILNNKIGDQSAYISRVTGITKFVEGYPREALWAYNWAGLDAKGNPMVYTANGDKTRLMRSLKAEDILFAGTTQPKYNGSVRTGFRYKSLQLDFLFTYNYGHVFRVEYPTMNPWDDQTMNKLVGNRWMKEGDEAITDIPCLPNQPTMDEDDWAAYDGRDNLARYSSNSVRKGGMFRFREILLNYDLPKSIIKNTPIKRLAITAQLDNIALWTQNKEGYDPEAVDPVSGSFSLRTPISFTAGIKVDF